jgi:hypothetical protein
LDEETLVYPLKDQENVDGDFAFEFEVVKNDPKKFEVLADFLCELLFELVKTIGLFLAQLFQVFGV